MLGTKREKDTALVGLIGVESMALQVPSTVSL